MYLPSSVVKCLWGGGSFGGLGCCSYRSGLPWRAPPLYIAWRILHNVGRLGDRRSDIAGPLRIPGGGGVNPSSSRLRVWSTKPVGLTRGGYRGAGPPSVSLGVSCTMSAASATDAFVERVSMPASLRNSPWISCTLRPRVSGTYLYTKGTSLSTGTHT